mmetsp:Transcript_8057/g.30195  ORF Transcript_8057/g.30195 Transcript_8057/m.30195 type:complete len:258 (+) Transcript_8057:1841-2614(+)
MTSSRDSFSVSVVFLERSSDAPLTVKTVETPLPAGASCDLTAFASARTFPSVLPGSWPVANAESNKDAVAAGSSRPSPARSVAASGPSVPCAKSAREIANSSSSLVSLGAAASRTCEGDAKHGRGVPFRPKSRVGTKNGPGMFSGSSNAPKNGSSKGNFGALGKLANNRPPLFRAACRNKTSPAPTASFSRILRKDDALGDSRYRNPSVKLMLSSGIVSRSTNTPSPDSLATTPIALLSITAKRLPCRIDPPLCVLA